MTGSERWATPTGLRPGDHACWTFADDAGFGSAARAFLDEGRQRGEQLLLVGGAAGVQAALDGLPERDELLRSGRLEVLTTDEAYDRHRGFDATGQVGAYRARVDAALRAGHTGLRVAADVSALAAGDLADRRRLHVYEQLADDLMGSVPMTALCLYDAALGDEVIAPLGLLHPLQHHGDAEPLAHLSGRGAHLALHGEVDADLADAVAVALFDVASATPGSAVLDLAELAFLDVAGARMLHQVVQRLADVGVQLRLVHPQRLPARVLALFDFLPGEVGT